MRRLKGENHAGQHRAMEERELYIDGGVKRTMPAQGKAMLARKTMRVRAQIKQDMMAALRTRR